ncbi:ATP-dependent RNA helicase DOB1 [Pancytospora philotis]|nr:ATP-dependent RNA helicase DOB1 [Pancytospora philotis]
MENDYFDIFEDDAVLPVQEPTFTRDAPKTEVRDEFFINGTRHEAVVPHGFGGYEPLPHTARCDAKAYKFELDTFQHLSLAAIERDESVLVSAHTSCGKTVVAEYAIANSIKNSQRVVYTSPIKALSNQKFRELQEEFKDVGLMTGDVTLNPTASCLVMTTEIFRNMLYRGSEVIREVHWVVFDEIHYMRDKERGVVWEETIILLPPHVRMVFLSATIPNALEFAEWVCSVSLRPMHVVYTEKRVIPLIHYMYADKLRLVHDGKLNKPGLKSSLKTVVKRSEVAKAVASLIEQISVPAVVFSFSRKDCEAYAVGVKRDFLDAAEKELVATIFNNALESLREEDRGIPIIERMLPLLQKGIGIHHSGLLPIIKEIVEILFQENLLKILFATETFSIGLNMPAKTVVFTSLVKFDGSAKRLLTSGEYIQMSGRAGRRGLDEQGIAVAIVADQMPPANVAQLFSGQSDKLFSAFRLTYNMILNLMRVEGLDPLYLLSRSFFHYQAYKSALAEEEKLFSDYGHIISDGAAAADDCGAQLHALLVQREGLLCERGRALSQTYLDMIRARGRIVDILIPRKGAPLLVKNAIVKNVADETVHVFVLTNNDIELRTYPLEYVSDVYNIRCKVDVKVFNKKFKKYEYKDEINERIGAVERRIFEAAQQNGSGGAPIALDNCLLCKRPSRCCLVGCEYAKSGSSALDGATDRIKRAMDRTVVKDRLENLDKLREIYHMAECKRMINVLRVLGHIDDTSVLIKGKMASEISTGDELVITEMIFNSNFSELKLVDMVSLVSCTICEEKPTGNEISPENAANYEILKRAVEHVCGVMRSCGIEVAAEAYLERFSFEMMDIVRMWMGGYTFIQICESTSIFEGTIIRTFKRLEELLRQLSDAALVIGNSELANMFSQGIFSIKRDIIFANSLYL